MASTGRVRAFASRRESRAENRCAAGQTYLDKAKRVLNYDYGSSKLVSVQALLLMAYREIGTGGMSASWLFTGMGSSLPGDRKSVV